jgi:hypothetical protein
MAGHGEKQSRKREQAIAALLSEPTVEAAAKQAKVAERTLRGWLKEPAFNREYREARRQIVEGAVCRLQQTMIMAVLTLNRNLTCGLPATEVRAAQVILEQSVKAVELADLAQQVEELRRQIGEGISGGDDDPLAPGAQTQGDAGADGDAGLPAAGPTAGRPGADPGPGGDAARPVAGESAAFAPPEEVTLLLPPGGQVYDGGGLGPPRGPAAP